MRVRIDDENKINKILERFGISLKECEDHIGFSIYFLEADEIDKYEELEDIIVVGYYWRHSKEECTGGSMLKKEVIKVVGQVDPAILSHCEKYKLVNVEVGEFEIADIIVKPDKLVKSGDSINCYKLTSSDYCSTYISLDDFDEWICKEWGKIILDFFFKDEPDNAFDRETYIVRCIDGDKESIVTCVDADVAKSLYYSKCIDYAINFDGVHDKFGNMSYVNDDDVNTVRIWLDRFEVNKWEEIL